MSGNKENKSPLNKNSSESGIQSETNRERSKSSSKEQRSFFIQSIKETDNKIKKLFEDILEDRRNTNRTLRENFDKIITPTNQSSINFLLDKTDGICSSSNSIKPTLSSHYVSPNKQKDNNYNKKSDDKHKNKPLNGKHTQEILKLSNELNKEPGSNNTSILLRDGANEDLDLSMPHENQFKTDSDEEFDNIRVIDSNHKKKNIISVTKHVDDDTLSDDSLENLSMDQCKTIEFTAKKNQNKFNFTTDLRDISAVKNKFIIDDSILSPCSTNNMLGTLKSADFNYGHDLDKFLQSENDELNLLQLAKNVIDFGQLYHTQTCNETIELFNKGKDALVIEAKIIKNNKFGECYFQINKEQKPSEKQIIKIEGYSFISFALFLKGTQSLLDKIDIKNRFQISIANSKSKNFKELLIKACFEPPSLHFPKGIIVDYYQNKLPIIITKINQNSKSEVVIPFMNQGSRPIIIEFSSICGSINERKETNSQWEILHSSKFLTLQPREEKSLTVTILKKNYFELTRNKMNDVESKIILKAKIKETNLVQCFIIQVIDNQYLNQSKIR